MKFTCGDIKLERKKFNGLVLIDMLELINAIDGKPLTKELMIMQYQFVVDCFEGQTTIEKLQEEEVSDFNDLMKELGERIQGKAEKKSSNSKK